MTPYYDQDGIQIWLGDCRAILPTLSGIDCVVTDPPYGIDLKEGYNAGKPRSNYLHKGSYGVYEDTLDNLREVVVVAIVASLAASKRGLVFCTQNRIREFPEPTALGAVYLPSGCGRTKWGFNNLAVCLLYGVSPTIGNGCSHTVLKSNATVEANGHPCPKPLTWMRWAVNMASTIE
jgi:hypothetical protein